MVEGFILLIFGMTMVFFFLFILFVVVTITSKLVAKFEGDSFQQDTSLEPIGSKLITRKEINKEDDNEILAVISAAVSYYYKNKESKN